MATRGLLPDVAGSARIDRSHQFVKLVSEMSHLEADHIHTLYIAQSAAFPQ